MHFEEHPHTAELKRLRAIARRMDKAFIVPVIGMRVGWDSIIGLVPGIGDALAFLPAAYIVKEGHRLGAPRNLLAKMGVNVGIDLAIGAIPIVGDLFDAKWKANSRNVDLLEKHFSDLALKARDVTEVEGKLSSHHPSLR